MRSLPLCAASLVLACAGTAPTTPTTLPARAAADCDRDRDEEIADGEDDRPPRIVFNLERGALTDVARMLARVTGLAVSFSPDLDPLAECITMSLVSPDELTVDQVVQIVRDTLAESNVSVQRTDTALIFSLSGRPPIASCAHAPPEPVVSAPPPPPVSPPPPLGADVLAGIRRVSDTEFTITRAALDRALGNGPDGVMSTVRLIPYEQNGTVVGVRIYGVRRDSAAGALGLLNGDTLLRVNGRSFRTPDEAQAIYDHLRDSDRIEVEITRQGQPITLRYRIVQALPQ